MKKIKWPLSRRICVDWSWATINALIKVINDMSSVSEYIVKCYEILENKEKIKSNFVIIQICCGRFLKTCLKDIKDCNKNEQQSNLYKKVMIKAINICTIEDFWIWFINITILLLSKYKNAALEETLEYFFVFGH